MKVEVDLSGEFTFIWSHRPDKLILRLANGDSIHLWMTGPEQLERMAMDLLKFAEKIQDPIHPVGKEYGG